MKKLLLLLTILGYSLSSMAATKVGSLYYTFSGSTATVAKWSGTKYSGNITIPSTVTSGGKTYTVTEVAYEAFSGCSGLTAISFPSTVTKIGSAAFTECTGLTSIVIPGTLKEVGSQAFWDCTSVSSITISEGVTIIGYQAFSRCGSATTLTIPESLVSIGNGAFSGLNSLTTIQWNAISAGNAPDKGSPFNGCPSLTTVVFGDNVKSIPTGLFKGITSLTTVTIPDGVTTIGESVFNGCKGLTSITIPESVTSMGAKLFYDCNNLASVNIPSGVTSIESYIFYQCTSLPSITIPEGVIYIGEYAFYSCANLPSVIIPESVTSIEKNAFQNCSGLTSVNIPEGVTVLNDYVFAGCSSLPSITIPEGVTTIGRCSFRSCTGLTSVIIPEGVEHMTGEAFSKCTGLKNVVWNAKSVSSADYFVSSAYRYIFSEVTSIESIIFGPNVKTIPAYLCYSQVTDRGKTTKYNMTKITSVEIPASVTNIEEGAFNGCTKITSVTCHATTPPTCGSDVFGASTTSPYSKCFYIPEGTKYAYHEADVWNSFFKAVSFAETRSSITLSTYEDRYRDVTLTDRTIRTGGYNTLCLPFDMTAEDIAQSSLKDATIYRFVRATGNADDGLYINFAPTTSMEAGVPYIVTTETDIANPKFIASQIIENTGHSTVGDGTGNVEFVAHMYSEKLPAGDKSNLFFTADGLTWSEVGDATTMPAFRAYFHVNDASAVARRCPARVVLHEEVATALEYTPSSMDKENIAGASKSIINGQLVITRGEQQYTIQGQRIY